MKIIRTEIKRKEQIVEIECLAPLYLPFYNECCQNKYYFYRPFKFDPFEIWAFTTSGSPCILGQNLFVGFLNETGGTFEYDGAGCLTVTVPAGQELFVSEGGDPFEAWKEYNNIIISSEGFKTPYYDHKEEFWKQIEYCTWVEQKHLAAVEGGKNVQSVLSEEFVYDYMRRVKALGLPTGKLTIDDGWDLEFDENGKRIYGNWEPDPTRFPHFEQMVKDMTDNGFIPGLWFAPFTMTPSCRLAKTHPELVGHTWSQDPIAESDRKLHYIVDDDALDDYYKSIFHKYIDMGFKKFKLDMSYGNKREMKLLMKRIYRIIKEKDPSVEVETHMPDIFLAKYSDTVRINDVLLDDNGVWRGVTTEHWRVSRNSCDKILNLDHIGTNTPMPREEDYVMHTKMLLALKGGYPCVSLLPDNFGGETEKSFVDAVNAWKFTE